MLRHRQLCCQNQVHDRENGFLDFTSIAGAADDDFFGSIIDDDEALGIQSVFLSVRLKVGGVKDGELRSVLFELGGLGANEHVSRKGVVPGVVIDDTNWQGFREVSSAVKVLNEQ